MGSRDRYEAQKQARERRAQENTPQPWWWLGQLDPIVRLTKWLVVWTALLFVGTLVSAAILFKTDRTLKDTLEKSQRPWVVAEMVESIPSNIMVNQEYYCRIGYRVHMRNTGNSIAASLIFDSRAVPFPPTWLWLRDRVDKLKEDTIKLWSVKRPPGLPIGITLAPNQPIAPMRCPAFADGADPSPQQAKTGAYLVIGFAQYRDQYGIEHHTRFAFNPDTDSVRPWDGKTYAIYNDYQEAD